MVVGNWPISQRTGTKILVIYPSHGCWEMPNIGLVWDDNNYFNLYRCTNRELSSEFLSDFTVALSTRIGLIFATKAVIRGNVHKKPPEIRCAFQTNRYLKGFGLFWRHYEVTNGWNSKKKIREAYLYKKIFEITIIRLTMAEIKQFSIIQAFTALWEIKDKEMASVSNWILNFIKMNKIGIKLIQDTKINRKFEFWSKFGVILKSLPFP